MTKRKIDPDVVRMTHGERAAEIMRLRSAVRRRRDAKGNAKCWLLDEALYAVLPEAKRPGSINIPRAKFLTNCARYYDRNQCPSR